jgi:hypothetical protein
MKDKLLVLNSHTFILPPSYFILAFHLPIYGVLTFFWISLARLK